jgi:hypothetical protein
MNIATFLLDCCDIGINMFEAKPGFFAFERFLILISNVVTCKDYNFCY